MGLENLIKSLKKHYITKCIEYDKFCVLELKHEETKKDYRLTLFDNGTMKIHCSSDINILESKSTGCITTVFIAVNGKDEAIKNMKLKNIDKVILKYKIVEFESNNHTTFDSEAFYEENKKKEESKLELTDLNEILQILKDNFSSEELITISDYSNNFERIEA